MDYGFHPEAAAELGSAMSHHKGQRTDLGRKFLADVARAISFLRTYPNASPKVSARSRRRRTRRFPYGIVYQVREGKIGIIAVMDLRRKPGYWLDREQ